MTGDAGALVPVPEGSSPATQPGAGSPESKPDDRSRVNALQIPHRSRFFLVYGLLAAALGVAAAGVVVFAGRAIHPAPPWSAWRPHGGGLGAAREIGDHVAGAYRLPSGKQLVDVITKEPSVSPSSNTSIPIHYVALRGSPKGKVDQVIPISSSDSVMFSLCGLGPACAIATGTASVARGRLVRREILELALYTFRYSGIDNVIAFMPPKAGATPQYVVYLRRPDLAAQLHEPLANTLRSKTPLPNTIPIREVSVVDSTTESRLYSFSYSQAQQGDAILVLDPLPA